MATDVYNILRYVVLTLNYYVMHMPHLTRALATSCICLANVVISVLAIGPCWNALETMWVLYWGRRVGFRKSALSRSWIGKNPLKLEIERTEKDI